MPIFDRQALLAHLRSQFKVNRRGHHGIQHWARVRANGFMLADETAANRHVVELFAFPTMSGGSINMWTIAAWPKNQFTTCTYQGHSFQVFATSHLSRGWSMQRVAELGQKLREHLQKDG